VRLGAIDLEIRTGHVRAATHPERFEDALARETQNPLPRLPLDHPLEEVVALARVAEPRARREVGRQCVIARDAPVAPAGRVTEHVPRGDRSRRFVGLIGKRQILRERLVEIEDLLGGEPQDEIRKDRFAQGRCLKDRVGIHDVAATSTCDAESLRRRAVAIDDGDGDARHGCDAHPAGKLVEGCERRVARRGHRFDSACRRYPVRSEGRCATRGEPAATGHSAVVTRRGIGHVGISVEGVGMTTLVAIWFGAFLGYGIFSAQVSSEVVAMIGVRSVLLVLGASVVGAPLAAQGHRAAWFEAGAGIGVVDDVGSHQDHVGLALDATVGWRFRPQSGWAALLALSGGTQGSMGSTDACEVVPGGRCARDHTRFRTMAALVGWELRGSGGASLRGLTGPAYYHLRADDGSTAGRLGLQARIDVATPSLRRVALVASLRVGGPFQRFDGHNYHFGAVAAGLRVQ
jgi:hypothetical protein